MSDIKTVKVGDTVKVLATTYSLTGTIGSAEGHTVGPAIGKIGEVAGVHDRDISVKGVQFDERQGCYVKKWEKVEKVVEDMAGREIIPKFNEFMNEMTIEFFGSNKAYMPLEVGEKRYETHQWVKDKKGDLALVPKRWLKAKPKPKINYATADLLRVTWKGENPFGQYNPSERGQKVTYFRAVRPKYSPNTVYYLNEATGTHLGSYDHSLPVDLAEKIEVLDVKTLF